MSIKLADILSRDSLLPQLCSFDKQGVLSEFANLAAKVTSTLNESEILEILSCREKRGTTAIGNHIAIPHGKSQKIDKIIALFGRSEKGIDFCAFDEKPIHIFFVLIAPEEGSKEYLHAIARITKILKNEAVRNNLRECQTDEIFDILMLEDQKF